jgi:hypothetical protein
MLVPMRLPGLTRSRYPRERPHETERVIIGTQSAAICALARRVSPT